MDAHHRKIDLQSPSDLTYLLTNIKRAAQEKIDLAIPPSAAPAGEDAYRAKVEHLVQEYITCTLTLALPSLTINGLDPSPTTLLPPHPQPQPQDPTSTTSTSLPLDPSNYEPYDPRLADRLRNLYAQFDTESTAVAEMRREAPGAAARAYVEALGREMGREKVGGEEEEEGEEAVELGVRGLERREAVERAWGSGVEALGKMGRVPEVVARLERAGKAAAVVEGL